MKHFYSVDGERARTLRGAIKLARKNWALAYRVRLTYETRGEMRAAMAHYQDHANGFHGDIEHARYILALAQTYRTRAVRWGHRLP